MKRLSLLIKPASSLCNMRCRYCFYYDISATRAIPSYGIMPADITDKIIDNTFKCLDDGDEINFAFQGGEPSIAGLPWFRRFTETVTLQKKNIKVSYAFQTNGLLLDEAWCDFFRETISFWGFRLTQVPVFTTITGFQYMAAVHMKPA